MQLGGTIKMNISKLSYSLLLRKGIYMLCTAVLSARHIAVDGLSSLAYIHLTHTVHACACSKPELASYP